MRRQLVDVQSWGEPIAALWASEASIYGRFGYGAAAPGFVAKSNVGRFALKEEPPSNLSVRLTDAEEAYRLVPPVYDRFRAGRAGMLSRSETWWKELRLADPKEWRRGASQKFYAVAEVDGKAEGYTTYRVKDDWEDGFSKSEVRVVELFGTSAEVELALWRFIHCIDLTVKVDVFSVAPDARSSRPARARTPLRRCALAASRRPRSGPQGSLVQAGGIPRARGHGRALPVERRPLPRR
jgi:predicted acetyltransferase